MESLESAVLEYLVDLKYQNAECSNPSPDGSPCRQCHERERVIYALERILVQNSAVDAKTIVDRYDLAGVSPTSGVQ